MEKIISKREILNRIKKHYDIHSNADLARFLDVAPTTIASWYSRDSINYDLIFAKCEQTDLNWLIRGSSKIPVTDNCQATYSIPTTNYQAQLRIVAQDVLKELEELVEKRESKSVH